MIIHLVNPNSTAETTEAAAASARAVASPGTRILAANPADTPASIEGYADEARSVPAMLALIERAEREGAAAHVIACFDDPGLDAAREVARRPVIGMCEAAIRAASVIAARYSIVTTLPRSVPIIEDLAGRHGAGRRLVRVRAADIPVLALEHEPEAACARVGAELARAVAEDGAEALILGCAGMSAHLDRLSAAAGVPLIDGVTVGVKLAEALAGLGLMTSKRGAYAFPRRKGQPPSALPETMGAA